METRASYALIGGFLIAGLIAFAGFVVWLGQVQFNRAYAEYDVVFEGAVNGLTEGGEVRYLGIGVGEVDELSLHETDPDKVIAHIRVDAKTPIRSDSTAILDFAGLTGVTFIQIQPGTDSSPLLPKKTGRDVPIIRTVRTPLEEIFTGSQDLIRNAQVTLARVNTLLDEENAESIRNTLNNVERLTSTFAEDEELLIEAAEALAAMSRAGKAIGDAAESFKGLGSDAQEQFSALADSALSLFSQAEQTVKRAEEAIDEGQGAIEDSTEALIEPTSEAVEEIQLMASDIRQLVRRLDRIARDLEQNPQMLIQGSPKPYREE